MEAGFNDCASTPGSFQSTCLVRIFLALGLAFEGGTDGSGCAAIQASQASERLGGWNCYYEPPGSKIMRLGWGGLYGALRGEREQAPAIIKETETSNTMCTGEPGLVLPRAP
jgi:hypothetical protein